MARSTAQRLGASPPRAHASPGTPHFCASGTAASPCIPAPPPPRAALCAQIPRARVQAQARAAGQHRDTEARLSWASGFKLSQAIDIQSRYRVGPKLPLLDSSGVPFSSSGPGRTMIHRQAGFRSLSRARSEVVAYSLNLLLHHRTGYLCGGSLQWQGAPLEHAP
ncbi:hypothetical protein C8J57DRAFT_43929 [Mycena rebaudengoi]|nr:hypothetical protein C8J57DRAFT_43929 [Mycena rebaudengoi]